MTFRKMQNYGDSKKISDGEGLEGREGWTGRAQKIFQGSETILCDMVTVYICRYTYVKTQTMYNTKN